MVHHQIAMQARARISTALGQLAAVLVTAGAAAGQTFATHGDERLRALIDEALESNPKVLQAFADYRAATHRVPQASALPDPTVSVTQFARAIETRVGSERTMVSLSQRIPGFGKRASQEQIASKAAAYHAETYQAERAEVVRKLKNAYYDLGYVDRALAVSREDQDLLEHFEETARSRYAQGFGLQGDVVRLQAQITQAVNGRERLLRQRVDLEASINALCARPPDAPIAEVRLGEHPMARLEFDELAGIGRAARPEIRAAFLRLEAREKRVHLAGIRFRPDFSVGLTWGLIRAREESLVSPPVSDSGKDVFGVTLGMSLPIFRGKYDAGVREASEELASARHAYRGAENAMEAEIRSSAFRIESVQRQIDLFESALLPQAEQALVSTQDAYANGELGVISLLDTGRMLLDVRVGLARLRADYLKAMADLERAVGAAVPKEGGP